MEQKQYKTLSRFGVDFGDDAKNREAAEDIEKLLAAAENIKEKCGERDSKAGNMWEYHLCIERNQATFAGLIPRTDRFREEMQKAIDRAEPAMKSVEEAWNESGCVADRFAEKYKNSPNTKYIAEIIEMKAYEYDIKSLFNDETARECLALCRNDLENEQKQRSA